MTHTVTTPTAETAAIAPSRSLAHLPVTLFSSVMGLGGLSLAWRRADRVWDLPAWPALLFLALAAIAFVVVAGLCAATGARHPAAARAELAHPVRMTFAPTLTIAILAAPPAVALFAWEELTGGIDDAAGRVRHAATMMVVVLLLAQVGRLRHLPFALPAWAHTLPLGAASAAAVAMAGARPQVAHDVVAVLLVGATTGLVLVVATLTLGTAARRQICVPE